MLFINQNTFVPNDTYITWGHPYYGGDSSSVQSQLNNVIEIIPGFSACAALKEDGTVVQWGNTYYADSDQLTNVIKVVAYNNKEPEGTVTAFAALKNDGTVYTWGNPDSGGFSAGVQNQLNNIVDIYATQEAFAAVKRDGTIITWGDPSYGGDYPNFHQ